MIFLRKASKIIIIERDYQTKNKKNYIIFLTIKAYEILASHCKYPFHLGITEAGGRRSGSIKSSIGIGQLLMEGIGDTIRVSLSSDPVDEVKAGFEILKSLNLKKTVSLMTIRTSTS